MNAWHPSQRGYFAGALFEAMAADPAIWLLTGDLGYGMLDRIRDKYPERFVNVGAAEQCLVGAAVGLALAGKKPFVYTITSFYLRAAETIALYLDHEQIPVRLVGSGRDDDYRNDGISHDARYAQKYLEQLKISVDYPAYKEVVPEVVKFMVAHPEPFFLSLRR